MKRSPFYLNYQNYSYIPFSSACNLEKLLLQCNIYQTFFQPPRHSTTEPAKTNLCHLCNKTYLHSVILLVWHRLKGMECILDRELTSSRGGFPLGLMIWREVTAMFEGKTVISSMMKGSTSSYESADFVLMALITLPSSAMKWIELACAAMSKS